MSIDRADLPASAERRFGASSVQRYLAVLKRRAWLVLVCVLVPVAVAVALAAREHKQYQATAQVLVNRQNLAYAVTGTPDPTASTSDFQSVLQTQVTVARSPEVAQRVLQGVPVAGLTPEGFLSSSTVLPSANSDVLTFHVKRPLKADAIRLTSAYAEQYVQYRVTLDTASLYRAEALLDQRLKALGTDDRQLASSLESKRQQLQTLEALQTSNASVIRVADRAVQVAPRPTHDAALALILGLVLAALLVAGLEALDSKVRTPEEVEERLGVPLLAVIPAPPGALDEGLLMMTARNTSNSEAFRLLRVALEFSLMARGVKSLLVTSSIEGEGKTTTVSNLAIAIAETGKRVVLLDLDLRRPNVGTAFGLAARDGVTDVLLGRVSFDDALYLVPSEHTGAGSLSVLPSGPLPPNPGELVGSDSMVRLIALAKEGADIVLIDAPPTLPVGDVPSLASAVDAMFLCVRTPAVKATQLDRLRRELSSVGAVVLGFVVTGHDAARTGYYGYGHASASSAPDTLQAVERPTL